MSVSRIPVRIEENRDGMMGYHGWSSIRKGEIVLLLPDLIGGSKDLWRLVQLGPLRYWVQIENLREIPAATSP